MPHCIVEHSDTLDSDLLVEQVFTATLASGLFAADGSDIKVRAQGFKSYQTGTARTDFIHVTLKILSGRTPDQKRLLSSKVIESLTDSGVGPLSVTAEVADIDRDSYGKFERGNT